MNRPRALHAAGRQPWQVLMAALLSFLPVGLAGGQATNPALAHLVRPAPGTRPLGKVLAELSRQGHLPFSYSSSLVPVAHLCTLRPGPARPLGVVLREALAAEHLSYGLLNGQLVLWPDRVAAPVGVVAVNGRAAPTAQPAQLPAPSAAAPAAGEAVVAVKTAAVGGRAVVPPAPATKPRNTLTSGPTNSDLAKRASATTASGKISAKAAQLPGGEGVATAQPRPDLGIRSSSDTRHSAAISGAKPVAGKPRGERVAATLPRSGQPLTRPAGSSRGSASGLAGRPSTSPARIAGQAEHRPGQVWGPVASLSPLVALPASAREPSGAPPSVQVPAGVGFAPEERSLAGPAQLADSATKKPLARVGLSRRFYLHGEAWVSESLPLNAALKLGIPRIYLVLGAAIGPFGRQGGGGALGVGLGTVGQSRGRFTPSLDLMQWFLPGDREAPSGGLTQLRPLLAWQLKQGGRLQLVAGPTLNLATARREGPRTRWPLGQDQWLWLDAVGDRSLVRLWPGVQLGLRF